MIFCTSLTCLTGCIRFKAILIAATLTACPTLLAEVCSIDITAPVPAPLEGHLRLGGKNVAGDAIGVNSLYIHMNGKPVVPTVGEFHYCRYPAAHWNESLQKMKAGGINIVATYVFWNVHEENEGEFDWSGQRNLRHFIELVSANNMKAIVRIGPFDHGEIRNGGLPDWLYGRPFNVRSNDQEYLGYVKKLYQQIGVQLDGLLFDDGGPVIGIQLENEYQHSAAPWAFSYPGQPLEWTVAEQDRNIVSAGVASQSFANQNASQGREHMETLLALATEAGLAAPIYTATGWGNASVIKDGSIPVTAAYAYPTWAPRGPSPLYLYRDLHKAPDYSPVSYESERYPSFAAELSGGIMVTYDRRPVVPAKSLDALVIRTLGSGSNGIGYYMYHGGLTPRGQLSYLSDEAIKVPKISYDFQAPIGEYGLLAPSFHRLKVVHFFLEDFGHLLAPTTTFLPASAASLDPTNVENLRFAVRAKDNAGFVCMHNYQDHVETQDIENLQIQIKTREDEIRIPASGTFALRSEESAILPFNLQIDDLRIRHATVQPLARLQRREGNHIVFKIIDGIPPEIQFDVDAIELVQASGCDVSAVPHGAIVKFPPDKISAVSFDSRSNTNVRILVIPEGLALKSWKANIDKQDSLIFSTASVLPRARDLYCLQSLGNGQPSISIYPALSASPVVADGELRVAQPLHETMSTFQVTFPEIQQFINANQADRRTVSITSKRGDLPGILSNIYVSVDYVGDVGMAFFQGHLVNDHFYHGSAWRIGLRNYLPAISENPLYLSFRSLYPQVPYLDDLLPEVRERLSEQKELLSIEDIEVTPEFQTLISFTADSELEIAENRQ